MHKYLHVSNYCRIFASEKETNNKLNPKTRKGTEIMKTTVEKIQDIINNTLKYVPGGASTYQGEGWSHTSGRKQVRYGWESRKVEELIKANPELAYNFGRNGRHIGLQYIDESTDTCYFISIERAQYIGRPDYILVDITYNWTVSQS